MQLSAPATTTLDLLATPAGVNDALLALVAPAPAATPGAAPVAHGSVDFAALLPDAVAVTPLEANPTPAPAATIVPLADTLVASLPAPAIAATPIPATTSIATAKAPRIDRTESNSALGAQSRSADAGRANPLTSAPRAARHIASPVAREADKPETLSPQTSPVAVASLSPVESVIAATLPVPANPPPDASAPDTSVARDDDLAANVACQPRGRSVSPILPNASANASPLAERVSVDQPQRGAFPGAQPRLGTAASNPATPPAGTETLAPANIAGPQGPIPIPRQPRRDDTPLASSDVSTEAKNLPAPEFVKNSAPATTAFDGLASSSVAQPAARVGAVALNGPWDFELAAGRLGTAAPTDLPSDGSAAVSSPLDNLAAATSLRAAVPTVQNTSLDVPATLAATDISNIPATAPTPSSRREEKIAAAFAKNFGEKNSVRASSSKTFLDSAEEEVTTPAPELGIDVAKTAPTMPAFAFTRHLAPDAAFTRVDSPHAMVVPVEPATPSESLIATDATAAAHRAVEAALSAAERCSTGDRRAVNLQFSVGGADLAVRVELRADEVRATFRTDSPELRNALAHEWSAVVTDAGERSFRLAPPVITATAGDTSGLAAFGGDSSPRQRDSQARRVSSDVFASVTSRARSTASTAGDEIAAPAARLGLLPTSLHLHTLA